MKTTLTVTLEVDFEVEVGAEKLRELEQTLPVDVSDLAPSLRPCCGLEDQIRLRNLKLLRFRHLALISPTDPGSTP